MVPVSLKSVVGRLNATCQKSLEAAAGLCLSRTNYNLEIEHWLAKLVEQPNTDVAAIFSHYGVDHARLQAGLTAAIDRFKMGNTRPPVLSPDTVDLARDAWLIASVEFNAGRARSGHLLLSLLLDSGRNRLARELSDEFEKISGDALLKELPSITSKTAESESDGAATAAASSAPAGHPGAARGTAALDQYTVDLTAAARTGKVDPVLGRDAEIRQVIDILMRRRQNNPILTGEAGVGKTAVAEGFALRIAEGEVPPPLRGVTLRTLDLGLLQAGASIKGEFETRLRNVIDEVKASPQPIILFIDEAHMMIGAGGQAGQGDAANLLKPALARGELRTIAATTWAEYKKYFEKDPALTRRFQVVKVDEPTEASAVQMMRGVAHTLEKHHRVRLLDEAVVAAVHLSDRYISGRQLPDKCVSLLDTACARVAIARNDVPPAIEDLRRQLSQLDVKIAVLQRELATGGDHAATIETLYKEKAQATADLERMEARWKQELGLVEQILALRTQLETGHALTPDAAAAQKSQPEAHAIRSEHEAQASKAAGKPAAAKTSVAARGTAKNETPSHAGTGTKAANGKESASPSAGGAAAGQLGRKLSTDELTEIRKEFDQLNAQLRELQGEAPLIAPCVDKQAIAAVVSGWTGIPVGRMVADEIHTILQLRQRLEERIVGQSHALEAIAQSIRTSRADLTDPNKPIGVFLMPGPSGVGKTETALALAELLYGGEQNVTTINMSEFKEEHKVSLLMGSPPGYVGYGEGGVLTEAVRRKPYSVLLLDEMEKAHPGVQDIFYQVFDKGRMRDGEGRDIDFKNTVIIMTSNAASNVIMKLCGDPATRPDSDGLGKAIYPELLKIFKPAFLGRTNIIPFFPLSDDVLRQIIKLKLNKIVRRVRHTYGAELTYTPALVDTIASRCTEVESGARNVDNIVSRTLLPELSAEFLSKMANGEKFTSVAVGVKGDGVFEYSVT